MKKYIAHSLPEYIEITTSIANQEKEIWFRGHSSALYRLQPSALRDCEPYINSRGYEISEDQMLRSDGYNVTGVNPERMFYDFKTKAIPFIKREPKNNFEWMFLMQHYGVPTRLLDWTTNSLIALYFSVESEPKEKNDELYPDEYGTQCFSKESHGLCDGGSAVFAINPQKLNNKSIGYKEKIYPCEEPDKWSHYFNPMNNNGNNFLPIAVHSSHIDSRIRSQLGHFTLHGVNIWPLDYYTELQNIIHKIFIPYSQVNKILRDLRLIGITESFIYPGLESIAREVKKAEEDYYHKKT